MAPGNRGRWWSLDSGDRPGDQAWMIFAEPKVAAEFERQVARAAADAARMRELGPAGLSVRDECPIGSGIDLTAKWTCAKPRL